jgi:hypothetical protein
VHVRGIRHMDSNARENCVVARIFLHERNPN